MCNLKPGIKHVAMTKFSCTVRINCSIDIVYRAYIDPDNMLKWSTDLERFEIIKGAFGEIGATARLYYNQNGRISIMEDVLEYIEPGRKLISRVSGGGLLVSVETVFTPFDDSTELTISWNGTGGNMLIRLLLPFLRNRIRKRAQAELEKFRNFVEVYGEKFPDDPL